MMSVMLRMTRASAGVPSVWRTPAMPHIRLVLPDWHGLQTRLQQRFSSDSMCFRCQVDGALLLGHEAQGRPQTSENRHFSVVTQAAKERHGQENDQASPQRAGQQPQVLPGWTGIPGPGNRIQYPEDIEQKSQKD